MRITVPEGLGLREAEDAEQFDGTFTGFAAAHQAVAYGGLDDLIAELVRRIERSGSRLRDIADPRAAKRPRTGFAKLQDIHAVEQDLAAGDGDAAASVGQRRKPDGRFAGSRFTDQAEHLAALQSEAHALDDLDRVGAFARRIGHGSDLQVANLEQCGFVVVPQLSHRGPLSDWRCVSAASQRRD